MKKFLIKIIVIYQRFLSPFKYLLIYFGIFKNNSCVFFPTCSEYTKQAIKKYGFILGILKSFLRIMRCHPWQKNHFDPLV